MSNFKPGAPSQPFDIRHSRDLDLITLRALEKDRTRRYESASALGEDIQRFLNHEPIHARAPSFAYVARRWVRRHRAAAAAVVVSFFAITGGAGVSLWQAHEARRQAREADAALGVALEVLSSTVELDKGRIAQLKMMIDRAAVKAAPLTGDPQRIARLHQVLAKSYRSLFAPQEAVRELKLALAAAEQAPQDAALVEKLHSTLALALLENDDFKGALPMARLALREIDAHNSGEHHDALLMLSAIGRSLARDGHPEEGLAAFDEMLRRIAREEPPFSALELCNARKFYPRALRDVGQLDKSLDAGRENIRIAETGLGPKSFLCGEALDFHARECDDAERWQEAHDCWQRCLDIFLAAYGPTNSRPRNVSNSLIRMKLKLGRGDEALAARRRFIGLTESAAGPRSLEAGRQAKLLIEDLRGLGRIAEAKNEVAQSLARLKTTKGTYWIAAESVFLAAGDLYEQTQEWQAALDSQREAMTIRRGYARDAWTLDYSKAIEGHYLTQLKRYDEAVPLIREGIAGLERKKDRDPSIESKWLPMAREKLKAAQDAQAK